MESADLTKFVSWFRSSTPYINAFRNKTFVIYCGGEVISDKQFPALVHDLVLLHSLGIKLVLVHGARPQIEKLLKQENAAINYVNDIRVTNSKALSCVVQASSRIRVEIEALLSTGLANTPTQGAKLRVISGNFINAQPVGIREGIDYQHTGEVRKVHVDEISSQLTHNNLVLLSPLGYSSTGEIFNIQAEDLACDVARQLKADKLIYLIDNKGVTDSRNRLIREITVTQAHELLSSKHKMDRTTLHCLKNAIQACEDGVNRCHLLDRHIDGNVLIELFSRDGCGSLLSASEFENLRAATIGDIGGIVELLQPLEEQGIVVKRSRDYLETVIEHFRVMERDGMITACAALFPYIENGMAEVACLAVQEDYQTSGRGQAMLSALEKSAIQLGIQQLFVLSTRTTQWFAERGFKLSKLEKLPVKKRSLYNYKRNSKIYIKTL